MITTATRRPARTVLTALSAAGSPAVAAWFAGPVLSLLRMVAGLLFATHGAMTLFGVLGGNFGDGAAAPIGTWPLWWSGVVEFAAGGLVFLGLVTRPAALLASGSMAYAYFVVHQPHGLWPAVNQGELAALYCWVFLAIAVLGPGPWSLDRLLTRLGRRLDPPESGDAEYRHERPGLSS